MPWSEADIAKASEWRLEGKTFKWIGDHLDHPRSFGSVKSKLDSLGVFYIKPPKPQPVVARAVETMERNSRNQTRSDRRRNALMMITDHADRLGSKEYPSRWPVDKDEITDPDEALSRSRLLIAGHIQALAKGALYEQIPTDVVIAIYVWTHSMLYWDTDVVVLLEHVLPRVSEDGSVIEIPEAAKAIDRWIWNDGEGIPENDPTLIMDHTASPFSDQAGLKLARNEDTGRDTERE